MYNKKIFNYLIIAFLVVILSGYYLLSQYALKVAESTLKELEPQIEDWFNEHTDYKPEKIYITYDLLSVSIFKKIDIENIEIRNVNDKISIEKLSVNIDDDSLNINKAENIDYFVLGNELTVDSFSVSDLSLGSLEESLSDIAFKNLMIDNIAISLGGLALNDLYFDFDEVQIKSYENYSLKGLQLKDFSVITTPFKSRVGNISLDNLDNIDSFILLSHHGFELDGLGSIHNQNLLNYYGINKFSVVDTSIKYNWTGVTDEIKVGLIDLTVGRDDKKFLVADSIKYEIKKFRLPFSFFEQEIDSYSYRKLMEWGDEFVFNSYGSLSGNKKKSSFDYEIQYGIEQLASNYIKIEFGGYTEDLIVKSINDPYYFEKDEALDDITIRSVNFVYKDEGLKTLGLNTLLEMGISRQDLEYRADQLITSSPFIDTKYKMQFTNAIQNFMAGGTKIDISFNSIYPDGIKLSELEYINMYNFDRYGEFNIKAE